MGSLRDYAHVFGFEEVVSELDWKELEQGPRVEGRVQVRRHQSQASTRTDEEQVQCSGTTGETIRLTSAVCMLHRTSFCTVSFTLIRFECGSVHMNPASIIFT